MEAIMVILGLALGFAALATPFVVIHLLVELAQLKRQVATLAAQVAAAPQPTATPAASADTPVGAQAPVGPEQPPAAAPVAAAAPAAAPARPTMPAARTPVGPPGPVAQPASRVTDLTAPRALVLGGGVFLLVGFLLLINMAIQNGWIGPAQQVGMGLAAGAAMFVAGMFVVDRSDYAGAGKVLTATGSGVAMAANMAGAQVYDLYPSFAALLIALVLAAATVLVGDRWHSQELAAFGIVVGLAAPVLVNAPPENSTLALVAIALVGACVLVARRNWPWLAMLSLAITGPQLQSWAHDILHVTALDTGYGIGSPNKFAVVATVFCVWGALLLATALVADDLHRYTGELSPSAIIALVVAGSLAAQIQGIFQSTERDLEIISAWWAAGIGCGMLAIGGVTIALRGWLRTTALATCVGGALLLAIAALWGLHDPWVVAVWSLEGVLLLVAGYAFQHGLSQAAAAIAGALAALHVLGAEAPPSTLAFGALHPSTAYAALLALTVALGAAALVAARFERGLEEPVVGTPRAKGDMDTTDIGGFTAILATVSALYLCSVAIVTELSPARTAAMSFNTHVAQDAHLALSTFWGACGLVLLAWGLTVRIERAHRAGFVLLCVAAGKVALFDTSLLMQGYRVVSFIGLGVFLLVSGYVYGRLVSDAAERGPGE